MRVRFEVWRVLGNRRVYAGLPYGVHGIGICISRKFARNHFGRKVWVAVLPFSQERA
jgi:hypothetical protein